MASRTKRIARLRQTLFDAGSEALERTIPDQAGSYGCPLCLKAYPREALEARFLTLEHAPPKSLGGSSVKLLTCKPCNSQAGSQVDHEMQAREYMFDVVRGTLPRSAELRIDAGGRTSKVRVLKSDRVDGGFEVALELKKSRGEDDPVIQRMAESGQSASKRLSIGGRFTEHKAKIGWARAGYLIAFALFGYRYILRSDVRAIHEQVLQESRPSIFPLGLNLDADRSGRRILIIDEPSWLAGCLAVQLGRNIVFLPGDNVEERFLDRFKDRDPSDRDFAIIGTQEWPWATQPRYLAD